MFWLSLVVAFEWLDLFAARLIGVSAARVLQMLWMALVVVRWKDLLGLVWFWYCLHRRASVT